MKKYFRHWLLIISIFAIWIFWSQTFWQYFSFEWDNIYNSREFYNFSNTFWLAFYCFNNNTWDYTSQWIPNYYYYNNFSFPKILIWKDDIRQITNTIPFSDVYTWNFYTWTYSQYWFSCGNSPYDPVYKTFWFNSDFTSFGFDFKSNYVLWYSLQKIYWTAETWLSYYDLSTNFARLFWSDWTLQWISTPDYAIIYWPSSAYYYAFGEVWPVYLMYYNNLVIRFYGYWNSTSRIENTSLNYTWYHWGYRYDDILFTTVLDSPYNTWILDFDYFWDGMGWYLYIDLDWLNKNWTNNTKKYIKLRLDDENYKRVKYQLLDCSLWACSETNVWYLAWGSDVDILPYWTNASTYYLMTEALRTWKYQESFGLFIDWNLSFADVKLSWWNQFCYYNGITDYCYNLTDWYNVDEPVFLEPVELPDPFTAVLTWIFTPQFSQEYLESVYWFEISDCSWYDLNYQYTVPYTEVQQRLYYYCYNFYQYSWELQTYYPTLPTIIGSYTWDFIPPVAINLPYLDPSTTWNAIFQCDSIYKDLWYEFQFYLSQIPWISYLTNVWVVSNYNLLWPIQCFIWAYRYALSISSDFSSQFQMNFSSWSLLQAEDQTSSSQQKNFFSYLVSILFAFPAFYLIYKQLF